MQRQGFQQQNNPYDVPSANSQNVNSVYAGREQFPFNSNKFSNVQPLLQSSGFTPPLYATAAAYMSSANPFYTNMQASGIYTPQYVGGYTVNPTAFPPYVTAYPPHGAVPLVIDRELPLFPFYFLSIFDRESFFPFSCSFLYFHLFLFLSFHFFLFFLVTSIFA